MARTGGPHTEREALLAELEGIRDVYGLDVKQFIGFLRDRKLALVKGFGLYGAWLEEVHDGKRYSAATINRKIAAAKSRVRYAFKRSSHAAALRREHDLEEVLGAVKLKKIDPLPVLTEKILDLEQARKLVGQIKNRTVRLIVIFLVSTGVRVSEMLGLRPEDLKATKGKLVQVRVTGRGGTERVIHVKKALLDAIRDHFHGSKYLFEHHGERYNRISVTNRIKHESLVVLGRAVTAQQLRHSWAAIQIKRGANVAAVAAILGHTNPGVTARMYAKTELKPEDAFLDLDETKPGGLPDTGGTRE